jgi:SAM-dependent methyltransferase
MTSAATLQKRGEEEATDEAKGCPLCGSHAREPHPVFPRAEPWGVAVCIGCGAYYTDPRPTDDSWAEYYPDDYSPHRLRTGRGAAPPWWRRTAASLAAREGGVRWLDGVELAWTERVARWALGPRLTPPFGAGHLLDVGCGADRYLTRMRSIGWTVCGVDRSASAAEKMRRTYGVEVAVSAVPGPNVPEGPFDLITMWQVLEHLADPRGALEAARRRLAEGGRIVITVPNAGGWAAGRFRERWVGWDLPRHVVHFTHETLAVLLRSSGLAPVRMATLSHSSWVRRSAGAWSWRRLRPAASASSRAAAWRGAGDSLLAVARAAN